MWGMGIVEEVILVWFFFFLFSGKWIGFIKNVGKKLNCDIRVDEIVLE